MKYTNRWLTSVVCALVAYTGTCSENERHIQNISVPDTKNILYSLNQALEDKNSTLIAHTIETCLDSDIIDQLTSNHEFIKAALMYTNDVWISGDKKKFFEITSKLHKHAYNVSTQYSIFVHEIQLMHEEMPKNTFMKFKSLLAIIDTCFWEQTIQDIYFKTIKTLDDTFNKLLKLGEKQSYLGEFKLAAHTLMSARNRLLQGVVPSCLNVNDNKSDSILKDICKNLILAEQNTAAIDLLKPRVEEDKQNFSLRQLLTIAMREQGMTEDAIKELQALQKEDALHKPMYMVQESLCLSIQQDYCEAETLLRKLLGMDNLDQSSINKAIMALAKILLKSKNTEEVKELLNAVKPSNTIDAGELLYIYSQISIIENKHDTAFEHLSDAIDAVKNSPCLWAKKAFCQLCDIAASLYPQAKEDLKLKIADKCLNAPQRLITNNTGCFLDIACINSYSNNKNTLSQQIKEYIKQSHNKDPQALYILLEDSLKSDNDTEWHMYLAQLQSPAFDGSIWQALCWLQIAYRYKEISSEERIEYINKAKAMLEATTDNSEIHKVLIQIIAADILIEQ